MRLLLSCLLIMTVACARSRPAHSAAAATSPDAAPGMVVDVTRSLRAEPPLPGDDVRGWEGLEPSDDAPAPPHQHHQH